MSSQSATPMTSSLRKLQISSPPHKAKRAEPADSWEDEASAAEDSEAEGATTPAQQRTASLELTRAPPPTPSSPTYTRGSIDDQSWQSSNVQERRPDKTTSVASRLIAAGIGQKAPRRTKEEREYDQAMKVQEKKKRDLAKAEEERKKHEKEKAQKAIWDD